MPLIFAAIRAFRKKIGEHGRNLFEVAPAVAPIRIVEGTHDPLSLFRPTVNAIQRTKGPPQRRRPVRPNR